MKTKNKDKKFGVITKKNKGYFSVWSDGQTMLCQSRFSGSLDRKSKKKEHYIQGKSDIVIGDHVEFNQTKNGRPLISQVLPRSNQLSRQAVRSRSGSKTREQVFAANIDLLVAVMPFCQPAPRWNLLDRYQVSAELMDIDFVICLTKTDLSPGEHEKTDPETQFEIDTFRETGTRVILTSTMSGEGFNELKRLVSGKVSVLMGKSGAGKSSILNALLPGLDLRVAEVNQSNGKGRHTTTSSEMFACESDGWIIDTPGTREFALWQTDDNDIAWYFPEMRPWLGKCRFGADCQHDEEPGCAIRQAVMNGKISPRRYFSMMKLKDEGDYHER